MDRIFRRTVQLFSLALASSSFGAPLGPTDCGRPAVAIHTIQGEGRSSPRRGDGGVEIEAIVVGEFRGADRLNGFFVQSSDGEADSDPRTSQGLFVFEPRGQTGRASSDIAVGDRVRVRGEVREFFGLTQLAVEDGVVACGRAPLPEAVRIELPLPSADHWERFEGMRVHVSAGTESDLVATGHFGLLRFGELILSAATRLRAPTAQAPPGPAALAARACSDARRILLDDGRRAFEPDPTPYLERRDGGRLRLGDRVDSVEGVLDYAFGHYRVQPTRPVSFEASTARPIEPPEIAGTLRIAGWNVENHFNGDGSGGGFPTRGPRSLAEFERQQRKLVETIAALDADLIALVEVENDGVEPGSAIGELIEALRRREPGVDYAAIDPGPGALGRQSIGVALVYRPDVLEPVGRIAVLDGNAHPDFSARHRPSLTASFRDRRSGRLLTAVANHWKSKGSSCASSGDPDLGDGAGQCNGTRLAAAHALVAWLAQGPTGVGDAPVLLLGDLNSYPKEAPIAALERAGFVDLLAAHADRSDDDYSFVFDGGAGRLDYALASPGLLGEIAGAAVWHVNADESEALDYRTGRPPGAFRADPFRASDHDPVLVGLFPDRDGDRVLDSSDACPDSPERATFRIGRCDSGVSEQLDPTGCSLADRYARGDGAWFGAVTDQRERARILVCAAATGLGPFRPGPRPGRGTASWSRSPR